MTKGKVDKIKLVALQKDKPPKEISSVTGLPLAQVWYYLRKLGVKKRKIDFLPSADELRAEGLSQAALAEKYGVSKLTIAKRLKDEAKSQP